MLGKGANIEERSLHVLPEESSVHIGKDGFRITIDLVFECLYLELQYCHLERLANLAGLLLEVKGAIGEPDYLSGDAATENGHDGDGSVIQFGFS